jgi:hypothetical protein
MFCYSTQDIVLELSAVGTQQAKHPYCISIYFTKQYTSILQIVSNTAEFHWIKTCEGHTILSFELSIPYSYNYPTFNKSI